MVRVYLDLPDPISARVLIEGEPFHHLVHVLRLGERARVEAFDGKGRSFEAELSWVDDRRGELSILRQLTSSSSTASTLPLTLIQSLPKASKWEWVIQKGTELGVADFRPVFTRRCAIRLDASRAAEKVARWQKIAREASRQSGRNDCPTVHLPVALEQFISNWESPVALVVLDEEEKQTSLGRLFAAHSLHAKPVALLIGPEGGWERSEIQELQSAGAFTASLGRIILRTETAALTSISLARYLQGAFD